MFNVDDNPPWRSFEDEDNPPWRSFEDALLRAYVENGLTPREIAERIPTRTLASVKKRLDRLGLTRPPEGRPWTREERNEVHRMIEDGHISQEEAARRLGRTPAALRKYLERNNLTWLQGKFSIMDVARATGRTRGVVLNLIKKKGLLSKLPARGSGMAVRYELSLEQYLMLVRALEKKGADEWRPWTEEEDAKLRRLYARGLTRQHMAAVIGRTPGAIAARVAALDIANREWWTQVDVQKLRVLVESGVPWPEIAQQLNRSINAVRGAAKRHGFRRPWAEDDDG